MKNLLKIACLLVAAAIGVLASPLLRSYSATKSTVFLLSGSVTVNASGEMVSKCDYTYDRAGKCLTAHSKRLIENPSVNDGAPAASHTTFTYDALGRPIEKMTRDDDNQVTADQQLTYHDSGALQKVVLVGKSGPNASTTKHYDQAGRLIKEFNPSGTLTCTYGEHGPLTVVYESDSALSYHIDYLYDSRGRQIECGRFNSDGEQTQRTVTTYDDQGVRTETVTLFSMGEEELFEVTTFDKNDNVTLYKQYDSGTLHEWYSAQYDEENNQILKILYDENGNEYGRIVREENAADHTVSNVYTSKADGATYPQVVSAVAYDEQGHVLSSIGADERGYYHYQYAYDDNGNLVQQATIDKDGVVTQIKTFSYTTLLLTDEQKAQSERYSASFDYSDLIPETF